MLLLMGSLLLLLCSLLVLLLLVHPAFYLVVLDQSCSCSQQSQLQCLQIQQLHRLQQVVVVVVVQVPVVWFLQMLHASKMGPKQSQHSHPLMAVAEEQPHIYFDENQSVVPHDHQQQESQPDHQDSHQRWNRCLIQCCHYHVLPLM